MNSKILNVLKNSKILLFLIILLQVSLLIYLMNNKVGFFGDEIYTYSLSNGHMGIIFECYGEPDLDVNYKWIDGKLINNYISVSKDHRFDYSIGYNNQIKDSHPPLYNYLIHTICSFFPETFSKWYGFSINIVAFIFVQILLYIISNKLLKSNKYALLVCFIYGFSSAAMDCFVYTRMYTVLTLFCLLLLYTYLSSVDNNTSLSKFLAIFSIVALGGLTQYHFYIYAFFLTLIFVIYLFLNKSYKSFWTLSTGAILGVISANLYFPYFYQHATNSPRGTEALSFQDRISPCIRAFSYFFQETLGLNTNICLFITTTIIISLFSFAIYRSIKHIFKEEKNTEFILINLFVFIYITFLFCTIDYKSMGIALYGRYLFSIFPLIIMVIIGILFKTNKMKIIALIAFLSILSNLTMLDFYYPYTYEKFSGVIKLGEITENNNLIIYCSSTGIIQTICPQLAKCDKIYVNPLKDINRMLLPPIPNNKPTYLFVFPCNKLKIPFPKIIDGELWENKFEVYDLNQN